MPSRAVDTPYVTWPIRADCTQFRVSGVARPNRENFTGCDEAKGSRRNNLGRCRRVGWCGRDGVVPLSVEVVAGDREGVDLFFGVLDADGVGAGVEFGADGEPGGGAGGTDEVDDDLVAGQRPASRTTP